MHQVGIIRSECGLAGKLFRVNYIRSLQHLHGKKVILLRSFEKIFDRQPWFSLNKYGFRTPTFWGHIIKERKICVNEKIF